MNDTTHMLVLVVGAALATGALTFPITMPGARSGERPPVFLSFQTAAVERDPLADDGGDECTLRDADEIAALADVPGYSQRSPDVPVPPRAGRQSCAISVDALEGH